MVKKQHNNWKNVIKCSVSISFLPLNPTHWTFKWSQCSILCTACFVICCTPLSICLLARHSITTTQLSLWQRRTMIGCIALCHSHTWLNKTRRVETDNRPACYWKAINSAPRVTQPGTTVSRACETGGRMLVCVISVLMLSVWQTQMGPV